MSRDEVVEVAEVELNDANLENVVAGMSKGGGGGGFAQGSASKFASGGSGPGGSGGRLSKFAQGSST